MSERPLNELVGPEGLATTIASLASQLGSLEKSTNQQFTSLAKAVEMQAEGIRRETASEAHRLDTLLSENAARSNLLIDALRTELMMQVDALVAKIDESEQALRREGTTRETALRRESKARDKADARSAEIIVSKYDGILVTLEDAVRRDMQAMADVSLERVERLQEVKNLHWHEHTATHAQEAEAIRVAQAAIDHRLDSLNHLNGRMESMANSFPTKESVDRITGSLESRVERNEQDTRLRFERLNADIKQLEKETGIELRKEVRPVQDARAGQGAVIAAIFAGITIIVFAIAVFNFMAARGSP